ncbi:hypothetical protein NL676_015683 [Syzygium grande]|nr:hypothetical protein NL676_015683 [Syzygium grande]
MKNGVHNSHILLLAWVRCSLSMAEISLSHRSLTVKAAAATAASASEVVVSSPVQPWQGWAPSRRWGWAPLSSPRPVRRHFWTELRAMSFLRKCD